MFDTGHERSLNQPGSRTLIDLSVTNSPEKNVNSRSGVVHLGISDHLLVFMRIRYERIGTHRTIETRDYKKKNDSNKYT